MASYTTKQGDTFDIIARAVYGSELLAMQIAAANPAHVGTVFFSADVALTLPDVATVAQAANLPPWKRGA